MNEYIRIQEPKILNDKSLVFKLFFSKRTGKYFVSDDLIFHYDVEIGNPTAGILQIPAVASVITVAWAVGADVYVKNLDETYLKSLNDVGSVLKSWYPKFSFSTGTIVENVVPNRFSNDEYGLLFTGGIDSTASYIRHRNKKPNLITVFGAGLDIQSADEKLKGILMDFSKQEEVKLNFIETNVDNVINRDLLHEESGLNWWMNVYHGLFLTSLCAPLTLVKNIGTLIIASSNTREWRYPWGSDPFIEGRISWADVHVVHDNYEFTRQDKIRHFIKNYVKETGHYPFLHVCSKQTSENCGVCEKCLRTITGLVLEGIDSNKCGFHNVDSEMFDSIRRSFTNGDFIRRSSFVERKGIFINRMADVEEWKDIQKHIPETVNDLNNYGEFFKWLKDFDILKNSQSIRMSRLPRLFLFSIAQTLAPLNSYLPMNLQNMNRKVFQFLLLSH